ncbi:pilus assembly protein [Halomonas organivorans]
MTMPRESTRAGARHCRHQQGAVAIEFAIVFPLFLLIFYAIVGYSLAFVFQQGLHNLSADAVRVALAVEREDGALDVTGIEAAVTAYLDAQARWPAEHARLCNPEALVDVAADKVEVCVELELGLPQLTLPGIDLTVPHLTRVQSWSSLRL